MFHSPNTLALAATGGRALRAALAPAAGQQATHTRRADTPSETRVRPRTSQRPLQRLQAAAVVARRRLHAGRDRSVSARRVPLKAAPCAVESRTAPPRSWRAGQRAERRRHGGRRTSPGWTEERRGARLGPQRKPTACRPRVSGLQRARSRAPGCPSGASSPRCARLLVVSGRIGALGADCARPVRAGGAGRAGRGRLLVLDLAQRVGPRLAAICGARGTHGER